jgi:hypothetical protein
MPTVHTMPPCQVYDGLLLSGTLSEYEDAFKAVDKSGNGTIGESRWAYVSPQ